MPNNLEFLQALFGVDAPWVHVTDFPYDPDHIPDGKHLIAWKGDYNCRYPMQPGTNQYFTVSLFYADEQGTARRRKALYRSTPVVVLDDVKEKLSMEEVSKLPHPSWILETSPGSEQWGYILDAPCLDRHRIDNLHDGLVANGLAPDGRDPGQKGVTRYVRLPDGYNTKAKKMINGQPFKCSMKHWAPQNRVTLEQLAQPFMVNLDAVRRESRVDGAADVGDHPLLQVTDLIHIKEVRSDGRFDITCPWVDEHTGGVDNGAAVFTNGDGTIGFKCHHGACQTRTGKHLLQFVDEQQPGFTLALKNWQTMRVFNEIANQSVSFMGESQPVATPTPSQPPQAPSLTVTLNQVLGQLRSHPPFSDEARTLASELLKQVDSLPTIDKLHWHEQVRDVMRWSKPDFKTVLTDLRQSWYIKKDSEVSFFDDVIYVGEVNQFFDRRKRIFYSPEAYQNTYAHLDAEARKGALQGGRVTKVDKLDYAPKKSAVFEEMGIVYGNSWHENVALHGVEGNVDRWLGHFDTIGWTAHKKRLLQWMAFTLTHPDQKINYMVLMGSGEGCGKDYLLYPLIKAMGDNSMTIDGEELLDGFNDYLLSTKHLHINESELGDRKEAAAVSAKLKPLAAAPPDRLRVNQKGIKPIRVRNIVNVTMTTNSQIPLRLDSASRRIFALWSDMNPRDEYDQIMPEWVEYWNDRWSWMLDNEGVNACIWYLRNCVDLSDFKPGEAPPVTDFLRDIRDSSKTALQQTIESFIRGKVTACASDLITAEEVVNCIKTAQAMGTAAVYVDATKVTPNQVATCMKGINGCISLLAYRGESTAKLWAIRNIMKYRPLDKTELYDEYERQMLGIRSKFSLSAVAK